MNNAEFWQSVSSIIEEGFTAEGLSKLESYAEQFISKRLIYQRFSPQEQYGCSTGGNTHVIATLLAGADAAANRRFQESLSFKEECQRGKAQESVIEHWARRVQCWYDDVDIYLAKLLGDQLAEGGEARVFQPYIQGSQMSDEEIATFAQKMGFTPINPKNWTFATPDIYLSDLHDENVIQSKEGNVFVVDCDIRINTPELRCGGRRELSTEVVF